MWSSRILLLSCTAFVVGCVDSRPDPNDPPKRLSDWGVLKKQGDSLAPVEGSFAYSLRTPLFSDYAEKFRTVWMPDGGQARARGEDVFGFPIGTIISKTFLFHLEDAQLMAHEDALIADGLRSLDTSEVRLVETRLLVRAKSGWVAVPYVWNEAQDEAYLNITGEIVKLDVRTPEGQLETANYLIPSRNQCASCHARRNEGGIHPIGPKAWNVDVAFWREEGWLASDGALSTHDDIPHARRYLDVNCAHCHSEEGAGDTSGLFLDIFETDRIRLGVCKRTIAAGQGTGGRTFDVVPGEPDASILLYRMETNDPAEMMPELGRSLVHETGVALVRDWIAAMPETCDRTPA